MTNKVQISYSLMLPLSVISRATTASAFGEPHKRVVFLPGRKFFPDFVSVVMVGESEGAGKTSVPCLGIPSVFRFSTALASPGARTSSEVRAFFKQPGRAEPKTGS
jgi:hypothetical protein